MDTFNFTWFAAAVLLAAIAYAVITFVKVKDEKDREETLKALEKSREKAGLLFGIPSDFKRNESWVTKGTRKALNRMFGRRDH